MNLENTTVRNRKTPDRKGHVLFNSIQVKYPNQANPQRQQIIKLPLTGETGNDYLMGKGLPLSVIKKKKIRSGIRQW